MSPQLREMLEAWVKNPVEEEGLCILAFRISPEVENGLQAMFKADGLSTLIPFNTGLDDFRQEWKDAKFHLNPKRVAWVKSKVAHVPRTQSQT